MFKSYRLLEYSPLLYEGVAESHCKKHGCRMGENGAHFCKLSTQQHKSVHIIWRVIRLNVCEVCVPFVADMGSPLSSESCFFACIDFVQVTISPVSGDES